MGVDGWGFVCYVVGCYEGVSATAVCAFAPKSVPSQPRRLQ